MALKKAVFAFLLFGMIGLPSLSAQAEYGDASYYADKYHLRSKTASGELYDKYKFTAAHRTLPFGTYLKVQNLDNGKTVTVRVNDRGPFKKGRIVDLSRAAAEQVGMVRAGLAKVKIEVIKSGGESQTRAQAARRTTSSKRPEAVTLSVPRESPSGHGDLSKLPLRDHTGALVGQGASSSPAPVIVSSNPGSLDNTGNAGRRVVSANPALDEAYKYTPSVFRMIAIKENVSGFAVQLGAFYSYYRLMEGLSEINGKGINNTLVQSGLKDGKPIFRILAGPYGSKGEADQARRSLTSKGLKGITVNMQALN